jgi:hypothetical protein
MDRFIEYDDLTDEPLDYKSERVGEFLEAQKKEIERNYLILSEQEDQIHEKQRVIDEQIGQLCDLERKLVRYGKMASYII